MMSMFYIHGSSSPMCSVSDREQRRFGALEHVTHPALVPPQICTYSQPTRDQTEDIPPFIIASATNIGARPVIFPFVNRAVAIIVAKSEQLHQSQRPFSFNLSQTRVVAEIDISAA